MDINKTEKINDLLDIYRTLLTKKQQVVMDMYYADNYSLSEIALNLKVTRTAIYDIIKRTTALLEDYENKLHFLTTRNKILNEIKDLDENKRNKIEEILMDGE